MKILAYLLLAGSALALDILVLKVGLGNHPITVYLPDAVQGSQPFCLSNRANSDVILPHGATVHPGQMVRASVVSDFQWGFTNPEPATDRQDVDCFVVAR